MRRVKTIYCIAVIAIAIILVSFGQLIGWLAAIVVLAGALPMFRVVTQTSADATLTAVEERRRARANRRETS
jgi:predicted Na+-dependent transporter